MAVYPFLHASNVGNYVLMGGEAFTPHYLEQSANRIKDETDRNIRLGEIAAAPNVIVWKIHGARPVELDQLQKERLEKVSYGRTVASIARDEDVAENTERIRIHEVYDLLDAKVNNAAKAVVAGICHGLLTTRGGQIYRRRWLDDIELATCRLVGLGYSNPEIASMLKTTPIAVADRLNEVYGRIGAQNRPHAMRQLFEFGVFQRESSQPRR